MEYLVKSKRLPKSKVNLKGEESKNIIANLVIKRHGIPPAMDYSIKWNKLLESEEII